MMVYELVTTFVWSAVVLLAAWFFAYFYVKQKSTPKKQKTLKVSFTVANSSGADHGPIYRNVLCQEKGELISGLLANPAIKTLSDVMTHALQHYAENPCLGSRSPSAAYHYKTYEQIHQRVVDFGRGMMALDLVPCTEGDNEQQQMRVLGIYAKNTEEWLVAEYACYPHSVTTVPLYDTFGEDALIHILNETQVATVVCGTEKEVQNLIKIQSHCPHLTHLISIQPLEKKEQVEDNKIRILDFTHVEEIGQQNTDIVENPSKPDTIATFCYTSGTTGNPKGVMLTHSNFISNLSALEALGIEINTNDRYLSYLPLAHVFERALVSIGLYNGCSLAFYNGDVRHLVQDFVDVQPTLLAAVPRVLQKIHDKVLQQVEKVGGRKKAIFHAAYNYQKEFNANANNTPTSQILNSLIDKIVFKKIRKKIGFSNMRYILCGSAPLSKDLIDFFSAVLPKTFLMDGYGQTEATAAVAISHPLDNTTDISHSGAPHCGAEIKLRDVPDMGYLNTDTLHDNKIKCNGRGEICVRGYGVCKGYYKQPQLTSEVLDEDGWLYTGDIGIWLPTGQLKIVDRKKQLFKLAQGEYVSPEKIEGILIGKIPLIEQVFVDGDSFQTYIVALVFLNEELLHEKFPELKALDTETEEYKGMQKKIKDDLLKEITTVSASAKLCGFEKVRNIHLISSPFSVQNGMTTPTFKMKRSAIRKFYAKELADLYLQ